MKRLLIVPLADLKLNFWQSSYLILKGKILFQNTATGCIVGGDFFDMCKAGTAFGVGATIVCDQIN